jgi:hypothetical protein
MRWLCALARACQPRAAATHQSSMCTSSTASSKLQAAQQHTAAGSPAQFGKEGMCCTCRAYLNAAVLQMRMHALQ